MSSSCSSSSLYSSASITDLVLDNDVNEFSSKIYDICYEFVDNDYETTFAHEWLEKDWLTFTIQIDTTEILDLPKAAELEKMTKRIKDLIRSNDARNTLR